MALFLVKVVFLNNHRASFAIISGLTIHNPSFVSHYCSYRSSASWINGSRIDIPGVNFHAKVIKDGSVSNSWVGSYLLTAYAKGREFDHARKVFDEISERDVRIWTILLSSYSRNGFSMSALDLFREMQTNDVCPNQFTLSSVLKSCSSLGETRLGKGVHGWIIRNEINVDVVLENSVLDFYAKCGASGYAKRLFDLMGEKDSVSWNSMIAAYLQNGEVEKSLKLFRNSPCKDAASWNTMINGLITKGSETAAMELLYQMVDDGPMFNEITFSIALVLVSSMSILSLGKQIHASILRHGIHIDGFLRNSLLDMYCKCGNMGNASIIFEKMPLNSRKPENPKTSAIQSVAETISRSSMISGYVRNADYGAALNTFRSVIREQLEVDRYTLTSVIIACANTGVLEHGRQVHAYIQKSGHKLDAYLVSSLIDMYAKCGSIYEARMIFQQTKDFNVVLWTSMISGCALHGHENESVQLFEQMINEGITPNEICFLAVLTACSHGGLLKEGRYYFWLMKAVYGMEPGIEHFTCMVDIYGRAGFLKEAKEFIHEYGISQISAVWRSFLSSCHLHKDIEMGKWVSKKLVQLEPCDSGSYLLLSNISAVGHRWEEAAKVRNLMRERGVEKLSGQSWI